MQILNTLFASKVGLRFLLITILIGSCNLEAQVYYHDFGTTAINTYPYTTAPSVLDSHLSGSSWSNSVGAWTSNTGATGEAIRLTTAAPATITLTFNVAANYQLAITSFDFWSLRSALGPQNWAMTINGISVGTGTTGTVGAALGNTPVANTISGLTGTITVVISLSGQTGNGTYRLDDFTLNGMVTSTCTAATITSFSPTSGPQNTLVTINGSGFQAGTGTSAVNFNGIPAASFNVISDTVIKAYIPAGNVSGNISLVTNGCEGFSVGSFTSIVTTPNIVYATDLYISEIYDAQAGSGGVIEIYNGTAAPISLAGYSIVRHGNIGGPATYTLNLDPTLSINPGDVFLIYVGTTTIPCTGLTYGQIYPGGGFNSNDQFELVHNATIIDSVEISQAIITAQPGFSITRNPDAIGPQPIFNINDWVLTGTESCADLGVHTVTSTTLSGINNQPTSKIICENGTATFSVSLANPSGYNYQWRVQSGTGGWNNVTNSVNYSGAQTNILTVIAAPAAFDGNQYYCQITSPAGTVVSFAAQLQVNGANNPPALATTPSSCVADGSTTITNYNPANTYTFSPTGPTAGAGGIITGAVIGTLYSVTITNGCPSGTPATFTDLAQLPTPSAPTLSTILPTCTADGFTTITNYNAANTYTFSPTGPTAGAGGTISGAVLGTSYTVTASNGGCTSVASVSFTNQNQLATPGVPTLSTTLPTCTADGFTTITNYNPVNTYTFSPTGPTAGAGGTITGAVLGTAYTVTTSNGGCTSAASISFTNQNQLATPAIPTLSTTPPTCTADGFTTITNYNPVNTYTFSPTGPTAGVGGTITGAILGTSYTVTASNGGCTSTVSASFTNQNQLATPAIPILSTTPPTCNADGFTTITNYNAANTYIFSPTGPTTGAGGTISGAVLGTAYTVTASNGGCSSAASVSFTNQNQLATPAIPTLSTPPPTCTADGFTTITNYNAANTYIFSPTGPTAGAGGTISGAVLGTAYTVTTSNGGCTSVASVSFTNQNQLATPGVPTLSTTPPTCTADGFTTITNYNPVNTYTFSPTGPTAGAGGTITGAVLGTAYTVTTSNGGCTSAASISFTNQNQLATPAIPTLSTTPPTCTADGSTTITNYNPANTYTFSPTGPTTGAGGTIIGAVLGTAYTVTASNGGCSSAASVSFTNQNQLATPAIPTLSTPPPTCTADGFTTITNYNAANTYIFSPTGPTAGAGGTISGAVLGTAYTVTASNGSCASATSSSFTNTPFLASIIFPNPQPLQLCDPSNDGFETFDLTQTINGITGGNPNYGVSFHETQADAAVAGTTIPVPSAYNNINPWMQIIYIRVSPLNSPCYQIIQLQLNVNPTPVATQPTDYELCDYNNPGDGVELFNLTTKIPEILGSINPALTTVTFYTTMADAQAPSNAITNVTSYTSAATTLYVRVQTTATGCYDIVPLNLVINPLPVTLQPAYLQYSLCDNDQSHIGFEVFDLESKIDDILLGQTGMDVTIYPSFSNAQNNTNAIPAANLVAYENTIQYVQTLGIRVTNHATGCYAISTMDIRVEPLPVLTPPAQPYTLCDQDQDGYTTFDLTTLIPGLLNGITTYSLSFHETLVDAQHNGTTIPNPSSYDNILAFMQLLYVRAEDNNTHCVSITPIELDVDPSPIAPVFLNDIKVCDDDSNPQDASTPVDLTQRTPDVLAQQPLAASNYAVSYYHLQNDAQVPQNPIIPANNYIGTDNETVWVRVENTVTGCFNVGSFQLDIHTPLLLSTPTPLNVCDADAIPNDQLYVFDLSIKDNEINQGTTGTVTYYPSLGDAQSGTNVIATPTAYLIQTSPVQTLGVVVTTADGCQSITTLDIRVLPIPTPNTNPPALAAKCDDNNPGDGIEDFDLTVNEAYIGNHDPNVTFHYYASQADAVVPQNEIANPHAAPVGGNVWIRVENNRVDYQGNNCYVLVEQPLRVNPLPVVVQPLGPFPACDDNADGFTVFNLADAQLTTAVLGASQAVTDYTVSYYLTQAGANPLTNTGESALPSSFTNTQANNQTIYIRVTNNATGCVNATGTLDLVVEAYARAVSPALYTQCDQDPSPFDGMVGINLDTLFTTTVLDGQDPTVFLISYYDTDPTLNPNAQALSGSEVQNHVVGPDTIVWAMVENSSNSIVPHCRAVAPIHIKIEPRPDPVIHGANGMSTICVDYSDNTVIRSLELESGIANPGNYSFEWFEGSNPVSIWNGPTYTVDTASPGAAPRDYTVHVTNGFGLGCDYTSAPFTVIQSGPAEVAPGADPGYVVSEAFSDHQSITVNVVGYGTYEYSLDDGPRQSSNVFDNVTLGTRHVIHVWDVTDGVANSCEELLLEYAQTIDYPHYFTPNGDGIHDVWNISGLSDQHNAKIYIFDRYGKLLKQIGSSQNGGWDGTYNGHLMPSDDYWFTVDYTEPSTGQQRQFRAHFTLKR